MKNTAWSLVVVVLGVALVVLMVRTGKGAEESKKEKEEALTSREAALLCTTDMATQFHIHPHLEIVIDGEKQSIPKDIGIAETCMNSLHTHDDLGTIHVESPVKKDFTLGDFFAVWQKDFSREKILDRSVGQNSEITVTVNGVLVDTYEDTVLRDKDEIVIKLQNKLLPM